MLDDASDELSDKSRMMFGAGFVFGVMFTMLVLAVVTATVTSTSEALMASEVIITIVAGIVFAAIVGVSLYFLAFPENRLEVPVETVFESSEDEESIEE